MSFAPQGEGSTHSRAAGMWNQTGGYRLDGSIFDSVFRQAAADGAVDFDAVLQSSWIELPPNFSVQLWIPAVDPVSGAFVGEA